MSFSPKSKSMQYQTVDENDEEELTTDKHIVDGDSSRDADTEDEEDYDDEQQNMNKQSIVLVSPDPPKPPKKSTTIKQITAAKIPYFKVITVVSCIFCIGYLMVVGYIIYYGSEHIETRTSHNEATSEQCQLLNYYENITCSFSCNCEQYSGCDTCDDGVQYKYYAVSLRKCGNDTILVSDFDECQSSLRAMNTSCYVGDCMDNTFRFEYNEKPIIHGVYWIIFGCLLFCCPIFCLFWFVKQWIEYDSRK